jgi:hypothetical protein
MNTLITHPNKEIRKAAMLSFLDDYNQTGADAIYFTNDKDQYSRKSLPVRNKRLGELPHHTKIPVSEIGFAGMSYILGLNDTEASSLADVFSHCQKNATKLDTLSDLIKAMMTLSNHRIVQPEEIEPAYSAAVSLRNDPISGVFGKSNIDLQGILALDCVTAFVNTSFIAFNKRIQAAILCSVLQRLVSIAPDAPRGSDAALVIAFDWENIDFCNMNSHMQRFMNLMFTTAPKKGIALAATKTSDFVQNESCKKLFRVARPKGYSGHSFESKPETVVGKRHYIMAVVLMASPFAALAGWLV